MQYIQEGLVSENVCFVLEEIRLFCFNNKANEALPNATSDNESSAQI